MKIITKMVKEQPLTITVEYPILDSCTQHIINKIKSFDLFLNVKHKEQMIRVSNMEICYIETLERKTFIYTQDEIYQSDKTLYELENLFSETSIVRISRSCLMNTDMLYGIKQLKNSQLEATMNNGEKLIVARTYLKNIKKMFAQKEGK